MNKQYEPLPASRFTTFQLHLTEEQHGRVARYAVQNGMTMTSAVLTFFLDGMHASMKPEVLANSQRNAERARVGVAA